MRKVIMAFMAASAVGACATNVTMQPIGGSRADGVVRLAFTYGMFENPRVDQAAALASARQRCQSWGYTDAEPFGGAVTQCQQMSGYGCAQTMVTVEYQCTGGRGGGAPADR